MILFAFKCIPAKDHKADSNGRKYGDDNDPDDGIINVFFTSGINIGDSAADKK